MKKTYANQCLERASRATQGPWQCHDLAPTLLEMPKKKPIRINDWVDAEFIANSRTDVVELAMRLNKACELLREISLPPYNDSDLESLLETLRIRADNLIDELEATLDSE